MSDNAKREIPRDEFIKLCVSTGYAKKDVAIEYAEDREIFCENDFVCVARKQDRISDRAIGIWRHELCDTLAKGNRMSKHYLPTGR